MENILIVKDKEVIEVSKRAVEVWGIDAQLTQICEECGETVVAVCKRNRKSNGSTKKEMISEFVDLELMVAQMKIIFQEDMAFWEEEKRRKIDKTKARLNKN